MAKRLLPVGIDDLAFYTPKIYLDIRTLAEARNIPYEKLAHGLGLHKMALPDVHEDAATMAAEAIAELITRNKLDPRTIGRIYMGTESALDGAKPTATYAVGMLQEHFSEDYGADCFRRCDVLDMTFACIGAVDALQSTLDWVAADPARIGIVVASDVAKYELHSTGEYTQGAGAVAMLVRWQPRLLVLDRLTGISTESAHDFYKPRRERFTETPIFDGQYSNQCYQDRMQEALADFTRQALAAGLFRTGQFPAWRKRWARMAFHLPYAFHARRIYVAAFLQEIMADKVSEKEPLAKDLWALALARQMEEATYEKVYADTLKKVSQSALYQRFVQEKLESAQRASQEVGNVYTASIFLALMSSLETGAQDGTLQAGERVGFVAYGSGSKAKIFEGTLQPGWEQVGAQFGVFDKLQDRQAVNYEQYEALHSGIQKGSICPVPGRWGLQSIGTEGVTLGARYYEKLKREPVISG